MEEKTLETHSTMDECLTDKENVPGVAYSNQTQNSVPILQKLNDLKSKIQILRKEHKFISDEVKGITHESLLGTDICESLRHLGSEYDTLKKKYLNEYLERKRLYNQVIELKGNIRVFCRCRPLNQGEISSGCSSVVEFNASQDRELQIVSADSSKKQFKFDHVFGPQEDQEAVFAQTSPLVTSVLDGFNVCIFAYGQTGTGKTFTMEGTPESRGVNYRTLGELFRISRERSGTMKYELFISMLEVYNEKIRDLLTDNSNQDAKKLDVKQAADGAQEIPGLHEACVHSVDEVWEQLKAGSQNRAVGSTCINELSSRSHCLFRVTVRGENLVDGQRTRSHLWLVDLAGSERIGRTEVEGERLKESQFINKSLSALGDVISALASKTNHVPYRNSKLTHLLQSSLGGDCKTLMFVQISPSSADVGETLCSLNFASRVKKVEHGPAHKQADHHDIFKYKQMAEKQRQDEKEIMKLKNSLHLLQLRYAGREKHCGIIQDKARELESQLAEERKLRLQLENRVTTTSAQPSILSSVFQSKKEMTDKRPLNSMLRPPLRSITNLPSVPEVPGKSVSLIPTLSTSRDEKENPSRTGKTTMLPRRVSVAGRPPQAPGHQSRRRASIATFHQPESHLKPVNTSTGRTMVRQPKRRVSIATIHPESHSDSMVTPRNTSMGRLSLMRDPRRRVSRLFSPTEAPSGDETTPVSRSSKFLGSPLKQIGSWKPKHPTVVAMHKRHFVWSPLKQKIQKNDRKFSLPPTRSSDCWR